MRPRLQHLRIRRLAWQIAALLVALAATFALLRAC
jgi:hypothetical protein